MTTEPRPRGARCTATTEFGHCGYEAGGHTRHRAKTSFGELEWDDAAPAGTGSPTPAPDATEPPSWESLAVTFAQQRDEARAALAGEQLTVAEVLAVCQRAEAARDAAEAALAALRADFDRLHGLWEQAAEIVADEGDVFETDQEVLDAIQAKNDIAANDTHAVEVADSWRRTRDALNTTRAELAALRTEVGKLDAGILAGDSPADTRARLRALVTDQSSAAPPVVTWAEAAKVAEDALLAQEARRRALAERQGPAIHVGRSWTGHEIEDECPCPKERCGLVDPFRAAAECEHHPITRAKSMRQGHDAADCAVRAGQSPTSDTQTDGSES